MFKKKKIPSSLRDNDNSCYCEKFGLKRKILNVLVDNVTIVDDKRYILIQRGYFVTIRVRVPGVIIFLQGHICLNRVWQKCRFKKCEGLFVCHWKDLNILYTTKDTWKQLGRGIMWNAKSTYFKYSYLSFNNWKYV